MFISVRADFLQRQVKITKEAHRLTEHERKLQSEIRDKGWQNDVEKYTKDVEALNAELEALHSENARLYREFRMESAKLESILREKTTLERVVSNARHNMTRR